VGGEDDGEDDKVADRDREDGDDETTGPAAATITNWTDVDEQLRGALRRLADTGERMGALPAGCTYTVAVELRERGPAPIGACHPQPWIPQEPNLQRASKRRSEDGRDVRGARTTPIRSVRAGPLFFECWVEEGEAKEALGDV